MKRENRFEVIARQARAEREAARRASSQAAGGRGLSLDGEVRRLRIQREAKELVAVEQAAREPEVPLTGLDLLALSAEEDQAEDWLIEPLILRAGGTQLQSDAGLGKSLLCFDIAMALANADHYVLGVRPKLKHRVVVVDYENHPGRDVKRWIRNLGYGPDTPEAFENLLYLSMPEVEPLSTPMGGKALLKAAVEFDADLVIVDTLSRSAEGSENDADTYIDWYKHCGMPLKREGIAWLRLDHTGKDVTKGARGSSAKRGDPDLVWSMEDCKAATFALKCRKQRTPLTEDYIPVSRDPEVWEGDRLVSPLRHRVEMHRTEHSARVEELVEKLDEAGVDEQMSVRETTRVVREDLDLQVKGLVIQDAVRIRKSRAGSGPDEDQD